MAHSRQGKCRSRGGFRHMAAGTAAIGLLLTAMACSTHVSRDEEGALPDVTPGSEPELASTEGGIWVKAERFEQKLQLSDKLVRDPSLNAYLRSVLCRLAPGYCDDIRIYIVSNPAHNASMGPTGLMTVHTGFLLRCRNEADLASTMAHEIGHYVRRHSLQRFENRRDMATGLEVFSMLTLGYGSPTGQLVAMGGIKAFSRDQEREADAIGFEMMAAAGYDTLTAAETWGYLMREGDAMDAGKPSLFFSTHPTDIERAETLLAMHRERNRGGQRYTGRFRRVMADWRPVWMENLLRQRNADLSQVVLERAYEDEMGGGEALFFQGEIYRLRAEPGDADKALSAYQAAVRTAAPPAKAWRNLGTLLRRQGFDADAREAYRAYLEAAPDAEDRAFILHYLEG